MEAGHWRRMLPGLVLGAALGVIAHRLLDGVVRYATDPVGKIFPRRLYMLCYRRFARRPRRSASRRRGRCTTMLGT